MDKTLIVQYIQDALPDSVVTIKDPRNDGVHLEAHIISPSFEGMSLVKRHQLVLNIFKSHFEKDVLHALSLRTKTPSESI